MLSILLEQERSRCSEVAPQLGARQRLENLVPNCNQDKADRAAAETVLAA